MPGRRICATVSTTGSGDRSATRRFNGTVGGEQKRFGSGVFRMKPDGSQLEFMHQFNNNTWGVGFNSAGDVFGSTANNNPSFFCGIRATAYRKWQEGHERQDDRD